MFKKILIANRGEIAVRVIRACKEMGVQTVAVYSTADANALHVQLADEAYCIGGPRPQDSYLNEDAILTVAVASGATAIHPGYGFLSENAGFARRCRECGVVFVGPSPEVIERMGDKDARASLRQGGHVPIVPGCDLLKSAGEANGKPSESAARFSSRRARAAADAASARSSARKTPAKLLPKPTPKPRLPSATGSVIWRSSSPPRTMSRCRCSLTPMATWSRSASVKSSVQRRNQKLLEESPAPCLEGRDDIRERMYEAARNLARAVGYEGAGTH